MCLNTKISVDVINKSIILKEPKKINSTIVHCTYNYYEDDDNDDNAINNVFFFL